MSYMKCTEKIMCTTYYKENTNLPYIQEYYQKVALRKREGAES